MQERLELYLVHKSMHNRMICEKKELDLECCFANKPFRCCWIFCVRILTRKHDETATYLATEIWYILTTLTQDIQCEKFIEDESVSH